MFGMHDFLGVLKEKMARAGEDILIGYGAMMKTR